MTQYRQGDVLLELVEDIPAGCQPVPREKGKVVLAHGEATGHAHAIKAKHAKLFASEPERFLRLSASAVLEHQEHAPIVLPAGNYRVTRQREYSPEAVRNVMD